MIKPLFWKRDFADSFRHVYIADQEPGAIKANTLQDFAHCFDQTWMVNRTCKIDVAKMAWAVDHVSAACVAQLVFISHAHSWVVNCVLLRQEILFIVDLL